MVWEHASWALPAGKEAFEHRDEIRKWVEWLTDYLLGKRSSIVFTGMPGVGKTVLYDFLVGNAYSPGYQLPQKSRQAERATRREGRQRIALSVIPGDISRPRVEAIDKLLLGKSPPEGVVHVVANGYAEIRHDDARAHLVEEAGIRTLAQFREFQRRGEVEDLREVCQIIRQAQRKHRKPSWLIVASTKVDLYPEELEAAQNLYSPSGSGGFVEELKELIGFVGADNFHWTSCPACGARVEFTWSGQTVKPGIEEAQRDALVVRLWSTIRGHCES